MLTKYELSLIGYALKAQIERVLSYKEPEYTEFNAFLDQEAHQYIILHEKVMEMHKNGSETNRPIGNNF